MVKEAETTYSPQEKIKIKYLANHYYLPIALSDAEKADFIQHIIKHKSEVIFIKELEEYLQQENNFFKNSEWWYFSKIDETLDEVYIPYYQPKTNRIEKFKPDFIFWIKKDNDYIVLFIDPKSSEYTDAYRKIDGYKKIFMYPDGNVKVFDFNGMKIRTYLRYFINKNNSAIKEYESFGFYNFKDLISEILN
jgi:hypothetical protein